MRVLLYLLLLGALVCAMSTGGVSGGEPARTTTGVGR